MTKKKPAKKSERPLPLALFASWFGPWMRTVTKHAAINEVGAYHYEMVMPNLWLVQKGRKSASFTNLAAAKAFAGKTGKIRAFCEVKA